MKFFQKTGVAVVFTVLMIAAALFIGLSPVLVCGSADSRAGADRHRNTR